MLMPVPTLQLRAQVSPIIIHHQSSVWYDALSSRRFNGGQLNKNFLILRLTISLFYSDLTTIMVMGDVDIDYKQHQIPLILLSCKSVFVLTLQPKSIPFKQHNLDEDSWPFGFCLAVAFAFMSRSCQDLIHLMAWRSFSRAS